VEGKPRESVWCEGGRYSAGYSGVGSGSEAVRMKSLSVEMKNDVMEIHDYDEQRLTTELEDNHRIIEERSKEYSVSNSKSFTKEQSIHQ
jgi:UDP-3-O-acyl-N-acetylglucosamine deacetylase